VSGQGGLPRFVGFSIEDVAVVVVCCCMAVTFADCCFELTGGWRGRGRARGLEAVELVVSHDSGHVGGRSQPLL
jgi:hypothetical protein